MILGEWDVVARAWLGTSPFLFQYERRNCDLVNLGSLTRQFPDLSGSPLDDDREPDPRIPRPLRLLSLKHDLANANSQLEETHSVKRSPLDDDRLDSPSALDVLSSISKMIRVTNTWPLDDRFTENHARCCIGRSLNSQAKQIIDSVDGTELEAIAPKALPTANAACADF